MDGSGRRFVDYVPSELIRRKLDKDMMIELVNVSIIQLIGTDNLDVVGVNPVGCIFSEYSLHNPKAWQYVQPILRENGGWALFNYTPRGRHNHGYRLYRSALNASDWYVEKQNIFDTGVVSEERIQGDIRNGFMTEMLARQEYYCEFLDEIEGSYYGSYVSEAEKDGRIGKFPFDPRYVVYTGWDLGIDNAMAIWFFQIVNDGGDVYIRFIDHYENSNKGMGHYAQILSERAITEGYKYGGHLAPHDVRRRESNGVTVQSNAEQYGLYFAMVPQTRSVMDDIELCRRLFVRMEFNDVKCREGLEMLSAYHAQKKESVSTEGRVVYTNKPDHDWTSNTADAFRTCVRGWELGLAVDVGMGEVRVRNSVNAPEKYGDIDKVVDDRPLWERIDEELFGGINDADVYGD
jgi:hypothetical protein